MATSGPKIVFKDKKLLFAYDSTNRGKLPTTPSFASENLAYSSIGTQGTFISESELPDRDGLKKLTPFAYKPSKVVTTSNWVDLFNTGNDLKVPQNWNVVVSCYVYPLSPSNRFNCQLNVVDFNTNLGIGGGSATHNIPSEEWTRIWFRWTNTSGADRIVTSSRIEPYSASEWTNSAISCFAVNFQVEVVPPEITVPTPYNASSERVITSMKSIIGDTNLNLSTAGVSADGAYVFFDGTGETDGSPTGSYIGIPSSLATTNPATRPTGVTYTWWQYSLDLTRRSLLFGSGTINHLENNPPNFRTEAVRQNGFSFGSSGANQVNQVWEHYAIVFDNVTATVTWYKNGEQFWSGSLINSAGQHDYFQPNAIGRATGSSAYLYAQSWYGYFDKFFVYDGALDASEIQLNHSAHKSYFSKLDGNMPTSGYTSDHIPLQENVTVIIKDPFMFDPSSVQTVHGSVNQGTAFRYQAASNKTRISSTNHNSNVTNIYRLFNKYTRTGSFKDELIDNEDSTLDLRDYGDGAYTVHLKMDGNIAGIGNHVPGTFFNPFLKPIHVFNLDTKEKIGGVYTTYGPFDIGGMGKYILTGDRSSDLGATDAGIAKLFTITGKHIVTIPNPIPNNYDRFGSGCFLGDEWAIVTASQDDTAGYNTGTVYFYKISDLLNQVTTPKFSLPGVLTDSVTMYNDHIYIISSGPSVQVKKVNATETGLTNITTLTGFERLTTTEDYVYRIGDTLIINSQNWKTNPTEQGAMFFYKIDGETYEFVQRLDNPGDTYDNFGESYAFLTDASTGGKLWVGAPYSEVSGITNSGSLYSFDMSPDWIDPNAIKPEYELTKDIGLYDNVSGNEIFLPHNMTLESGPNKSVKSIYIRDNYDASKLTAENIGSRLDIPFSTPIDTTQPYTIEFMFKVDTFANNNYGNGAVILSVKDTTDGRLEFSLEGNKSVPKIKCTAWLGSYGQFIGQSSVDLGPDPSGWKYVAYSSTAGAGTTFWMVGEVDEAGSIYSATTSTDIASTKTNGTYTKVRIGGGETTSSGNGFNGWVSNIRVSQGVRRVLSTSSPSVNIALKSSQIATEHDVLYLVGAKKNQISKLYYDIDLTTASQKNTNLDDYRLGPSEGDRGMMFNNDGSKAFIYRGDYVREFTLSSEYDISTATAGPTVATPGFEQNGAISRLECVLPNGDFAGLASQFGTYSDYSNVVSNLKSFTEKGTMALPETYDRTAAFTPNGEHLYILDLVGNGTISQYDLTTPFDLSTATLVTTDTAGGYDYLIAATADFMIFFGVFDGLPRQVPMTTQYDVTTLDFTKVYTPNVGNFNRKTYSGFNHDGSTWTCCDSNFNFKAFSLDRPYDLRTISDNIDDWTAGYYGSPGSAPSGFSTSTTYIQYASVDAQIGLGVTTSGDVQAFHFKNMTNSSTLDVVSPRYTLNEIINDYSLELSNMSIQNGALELPGGVTYSSFKLNNGNTAHAPNDAVTYDFEIRFDTTPTNSDRIFEIRIPGTSDWFALTGVGHIYWSKGGVTTITGGGYTFNTGTTYRITFYLLPNGRRALYINSILHAFADISASFTSSFASEYYYYQNGGAISIDGRIYSFRATDGDPFGISGGSAPNTTITPDSPMSSTTNARWFIKSTDAGVPYQANYILGDDGKGRIVCTHANILRVLEGDGPLYIHSDSQNGRFFLGKTDTPFDLSNGLDIQMSPYSTREVMSKSYSDLAKLPAYKRLGDSSYVYSTGLSISTLGAELVNGYWYVIVNDSTYLRTFIARIRAGLREGLEHICPIAIDPEQTLDLGKEIYGIAVDPTGSILLVKELDVMLQAIKVHQYKLIDGDLANASYVGAETIAADYTQSSGPTFAYNNKWVYIPCRSFNTGQNGNVLLGVDLP